MKITKVEVFRIEAHILTPVGCRIHTDEGLYGDGEAALAYGNGSNAAFGMLRDLAPLIIGMDPLDHEVIWDKLYKTTFWGQNGGPMVFAGISAIDIALWDLKGKYFGVPVWRLLGGKKRDRLRAYASQLQCGWSSVHMGRKPEDYAYNAKDALSDGYDAVKIDFFEQNETDGLFSQDERTGVPSTKMLDMFVSRVAAVREAIGQKADLIIENHSFIDTQTAIVLAKAVEPYHIFYFEEANTPGPKMVKYLHDNINIPVAHGERIYSRWQYAPYFEDCSIQVIQPDIGNTGGITEAKKICDMAYVYDVSVQLHVCAGPLSTAAALQLEAVIPNFIIHEEHVLKKYQKNIELCIRDYAPQNGFYTIPDLPGLGNEWSEQALATKEKVIIE